MAVLSCSSYLGLLPNLCAYLGTPAVFTKLSRESICLFLTYYHTEIFQIIQQMLLLDKDKQSKLITQFLDVDLI